MEARLSLPSVDVLQSSVSRAAGFRELALAGVVVLLASEQVTLRSEDLNGTAFADVVNVINGTGGDLSQYRPLSAYLSVGLQHLLDLGEPSFQAMRFVQCLLIFGLAYVFYAQLGLKPRVRLVGIGLLCGLISLQMGTLGPSAFSLDRFSDTAFYLLAGVVILAGHRAWIPGLIAVAIANRETAVFMPILLLARYPLDRRLWTDSDRRRSLLIALAAWVAAAVVYFAIHAYYGPRPRVEQSYFGPDMFMHSLGMPAQTAFFVAAINLLPVLALLLIRDVDPYLQRLFWLIVPLWFAIHIWAARLGEGIMYLAPTALILVPLVLEGVQLRSAFRLDGEDESRVPVPPT